MKIFYLAALLLPFTFLEAFAQDPLSLSDAIQKSLSNNFDILIEERNVKIAKTNNNIGEAGAFPLISLGIGQNNGITNIDNPASFLNGDILNNNVNPTASLSWNVFNGFRVRITKERLEKLERETEGNAAIVVQNTLQAVILGYYRAAFEKARIDVFNISQNVSRDRYNYILLKKELGSAVTTDVLLEESNYLTDSLNLLNQELVYRNAIRDLNLLMAEKDVDRMYQLTDSLEFVPQDYDYEQLLLTMNKSNANLRKEYITQAILQDDVMLAKADLYPQINFNALYSYNRNRQDLSGAQFANGNSGPQEANTAITTNYGANFSVAFTLFNGGRIKRAIKNAVVRENIGAVRVEFLQASLSRDLSATLDLYDIRRVLKGIAERRKEAAEQNLELSLEQFKMGTINSFDYRQVQVTYLQAAIGDLEATYNLIDAHTTLMRLTGGIVDMAE